MARRIADVHGVDLGSLTGSGPRGRVVRADVMAAAGLHEEEPAAGRDRLAPVALADRPRRTATAAAAAAPSA